MELRRRTPQTILDTSVKFLRGSGMFRRPPLHYPDRPLHHFLQDAADRHPEKVALRFGNDAYTYRELDSTGNSFAHALGALGLGQGTRVALAVTNRPEWIVAQHGVSLAGGA